MLKSKIWNRLIIFITLLITSVGFSGGGEGVIVGNGGNTLYCHPQNNSEFQGYFTLDFLLDFQPNKAAPIQSWIESKNRIESGLRLLSPVLADSFKEFSNGIRQSTPIHGRKWIGWDLTNVLIDDQEIKSLLPSNCYKEDGVTLQLHQTVVRSYGKNDVEYRYQENILDDLAQKSPLQFSFFMVHEWLWDFTENVDDLRTLNWMIHSEDFASLQIEKWNDFLSRTQFFNRRLPVCHRSQYVKAEIEKQLQKKCENINSEDLASITNLNLASLPERIIFRSGDFSGLFAVNTLDLSENPGVLDWLPPYAFTDLINLNVIRARNSGFSALPDHLRQGPVRVEIE